MNRIVQTRFVPLAALLIALLFSAIAAHAQTTQFTYQGRLTDGGSPASGSYDVQVKLFDALTGGNQIGATNSLNGVAVSSGVFTVTLDFGAGGFPGANRWAEISARPAGNGAFTTLTPRQPVTSTPYAIKSLSAGAADGLSVSCNGCVTGAQIGSLPATSGNYIQNTTTAQANSNFNISGNGLIGGNVGIGTATPGFPLTFANTLGDKISLFGQSGVSYGFGIQNSLFQIHSSGVFDDIAFGYGSSAAFIEAMRIKGNGNVGIGTNAPSDRLHIAGRVRITGAGNGLVFPDGTLQTTAATGGGGSITGVTAGTGLTGGGTTGNVTLNLSQAFTDGLYVRKTGDLMTGGLTVQTGGYGFLQTAGGIAVGSYVDGSGGWLGTQSNHPLHFFTADSNPLMTLGLNGNFGIGTANPGATLHLRRDASGGIGPTLFIQNSGGASGAEARLDMATYDNGANAPNFRMSVVDDGNFGAGVSFQTKTPGAIDNALASRLFLASNGNVGIGTNTPGSLLTLRASSATAPALEINQGAIKVAGAGINTNTAVFVHRATAASILQGFSTVIDNSMANGDPNAILIVTWNRNPGGGSQLINIQPIGVVYDGARWRITFENNSPMPVGAAFNVMVVKP